MAFNFIKKKSFVSFIQFNEVNLIKEENFKNN